MRGLLGVIFLSHFIGAQVQAAPYEIPPAVFDLIDLENNANPAIQKPDTSVIDLESVDIPMRLLRADIASYIDPEIRNAIIFEQNGESYFRWIFNPMDTTYKAEVLDWMVTKGLEQKVQNYFKGLKTASASTIVIAPDGTIFSAKASTKMTPAGQRSDKKLLLQHMEIARGISDTLHSMEQVAPSQRLYLQYEVAGAGIAELDQAVTVRRLGPIAKGEVRLTPYFVYVHDRAGEVANKQGHATPKEALDAASLRLGKAMGELLGLYGFTPWAPHGQNFLDGTDGLVYVRDLQDLHFWKPLLESSPAGRELVAKYPKRAHDNLEVPALNLWGGLKKAQYYRSEGVAQLFYTGFDEAFGQITGIPEETLRKNKVTMPYRWGDAVHALKTFNQELLLGVPCYMKGQETRYQKIQLSPVD